jgi:hypothetical protein
LEKENSIIANQSQAEADEEAAVDFTMAQLMRIAIERHRAFGSRTPELDAEVEKLGCRINYETGSIEPVEKNPENKKITGRCP